MRRSDFFTPFISGFGYLLPFAAPARLSGQSEDLPGPGGGRTYVPGVSDAAKLPRTSPCHGAGDIAFDAFDRLGASDYLAFGAQCPCPHAPLPTLHPRPHDRRRTARGETRLATPFVPRDFHPLPFHQFAWRSKCRRNRRQMSSEPRSNVGGIAVKSTRILQPGSMAQGAVRYLPGGDGRVGRELRRMGYTKGVGLEPMGPFSGAD